MSMAEKAFDTPVLDPRYDSPCQLRGIAITCCWGFKAINSHEIKTSPWQYLKIALFEPIELDLLISGVPEMSVVDLKKSCEFGWRRTE
jgi:hypothetical protein